MSHRAPARRSWAATAGIAVAAAVVAVAFTALGIAGRGDGIPWLALGLVAMGLLLAWETVRKLTSERAVTDYWDGHIRFFLLGASCLVGGIGGALNSANDGPYRLLAATLGLGGAALVVAERRDFLHWRAQVRASEKEGR